MQIKQGGWLTNLDKDNYFSITFFQILPDMKKVLKSWTKVLFSCFSDADGLRCLYYLVQDLKCLVFSLIGLHFKIKPI